MVELERYEVTVSKIYTDANDSTYSLFYEDFFKIFQLRRICPSSWPDAVPGPLTLPQVSVILCHLGASRPSQMVAHLT
jgi:hypothetical protein